MSREFEKIEIIFDRDHGKENYGWYERTTDASGQEKDESIDEDWATDPDVPEHVIRDWAALYFFPSDGMSDLEYHSLREMIEVKR